MPGARRSIDQRLSPVVETGREIAAAADELQAVAPNDPRINQELRSKLGDECLICVPLLRGSEVIGEDGLNLAVSVNVSTRSLLDIEFPSELKALLARWRAEPDWLELECPATSSGRGWTRAGRPSHRQPETASRRPRHRGPSRETASRRPGHRGPRLAGRGTAGRVSRGPSAVASLARKAPGGLLAPASNHSPTPPREWWWFDPNLN